MSTTAKVLLTPLGVGTVTQIPTFGVTPQPGDLSIQHTGATSIFTATTLIALNAPTVTAPGVTFTATQGVTFANGVTAAGASNFADVSAQSVTAGAVNVDTIAPATSGAPIHVDGNLSVDGDLRVKGSVDTVATRELLVRDKVLTLGAIDADADTLVDPDDVTRDGGGIVIAGTPRYLPAGKDASLYEHSVRWERQDGDFLSGGIATVPHREPLWKVRGGGLGVSAPDHIDREANFFMAPYFTPNRASLGLYYSLADGRTKLVHSFEASPFSTAAPTWKTRETLVAALNDLRTRMFVASGAASYQLRTGAVPGMTFQPTIGALVGAPSILGQYPLTIRATNVDGTAWTDKDFIFDVQNPSPFYSGNVPPRWTTRQVTIRPVPVGHGIAVQLDAWDPYQTSQYNDAVVYSLLSGNMPEGVSVSETGLLTTSGFLSYAQDYTFTLRAYSEASHLSADKEYKIKVVPPPTPTAVVEADQLVSIVGNVVTLHVVDAIAAAFTADLNSYVSIHQDNTPDTYWALADGEASGNLLTLTLYGSEAMTVRPTNQGSAVQALYPPATQIAAIVGRPVTLKFYAQAGIGQQRLPFDLGDMDASDPQTSTTVFNGETYVAETSFVAAIGSPGECCNGGIVRSPAVPAHWSPRSVFNDYVGPTSTLYFLPGQPGFISMPGEYLEIRLPYAVTATRYTFDPTVSDVPSSWSLLGLTQFGLWQLIHEVNDVQQPISETDFGTHVSDIAADRVYNFVNTTPYFGFRFVIRATTGLVGYTAHLSGFSVVINAV